LPAAAAVPTPVQGEEIDAALQTKVGAREIPGVVAMAANEASVVYQGAFGLRNLAAAVPMSSDTVFRIASMVKLLTSVAALQLVEQGRLKLDEPAANIDPTLAAPQLLAGFDAKGVPQLRPAHNPLTLRNLLTHTSGFSYPLWDPNAVRYLKAARGKPHLPRRPLMFEPGSRWAYGGSLDNVGRLVEIASGQSLDRYFGDHITGPLGMNDTGFTITEKQRARQASLHVREASGKLLPQPFEKLVAPTAFSGGGGIPGPPAGTPQWRKLSRHQHPAARERGPDVRQPDRQPRNRRYADDQSGAFERRGSVSGCPAALGHGSHDQCRSGGGRPQGR
jgi:CubicO group peptidase (beta-lactamase class C family)